MATDPGVAEVLEMCSPQTRQLAEELRTLVREAAPEAEERGQKGWSTISYLHNGIFCYIGPQKSWVNLGFYRGVELSDPKGVLEGTGKGLRHVKVRKPEDMRVDAFKALVREAFKLGGGRT